MWFRAVFHLFLVFNTRNELCKLNIFSRPAAGFALGHHSPNSEKANLCFQRADETMAEARQGEMLCTEQNNID